MILLILSAFPGIGLEEKITKSSFNKDICLCWPLAILDKAAKGSPCDPVHKIHTSFLFKDLASFASIKIDLSLIKPLFKASSILFYMLLPKTIIFRLYFLQLSTICLIR